MFVPRNYSKVSERSPQLLAMLSSYRKTSACVLTVDGTLQSSVMKRSARNQIHRRKDLSSSHRY